MVETNKLLSENEAARVEQAISEARSLTSLEIVPIVSASSGNYDRAEDLVGLWAAAIALALTWLFLSNAPVGKALAGNGKVWTLGLLPVLVTVIGGFVGGAMLASYVVGLRRLFVPRNQMFKNVQVYAKHAYLDVCISRDGPASKDAVVLFVSLYERLSVLAICDELRAGLPADQIEAIQRTVNSMLIRQDPCEAIIAGIHLTAEMLARRSTSAPIAPAA